MSDSSIYISGHSESGTSPVKTDSGRGGYDYWVVHFNYYNNTTGIQNLSSANGVSLSPNPTKSMVTIKGLPNIRLETSLIGIEGRLINHHLMQGGAEVNYALEDVSPGMYLLRFTGGQFTATVKVVKE
ncbi:MAG: T9SS type A sorting domain-containing protein [Bacteroidetes bacterium]|nr:T9SS type A sorting domain-containing protein [Bacteroidota bacterium]